MPELLAPAGDWDCLRAAVANGADAVYFGLSHFNARVRAVNFSLEELPKVLDYLHDRNVRGYIAFNTLIFNTEESAAEHSLRAIAEAGADAVIVQDLGIVRLVKQIAPSLPVHASTQMTLTELLGIGLVRSLGIDRVILARELSLADIRQITSCCDVPVEVFVHGALCVAYSGQCLTSEAIGGRSANRGQCAQACRMPYDLIVDGELRDLDGRAYLLSPQDLAAYDLIPALLDAGVISFKIEGRLKNAVYVAAAVRTYRHAIDAAVAQRPFTFSRKEQLDLAQTFSRGFTTGFLTGVNHQTLVHGRFPKSRGVKLGQVVGFTSCGVRVALFESLPWEQLIRPGDGVLFDIGRPEEREPGGRVWRVKGPKVLSRPTKPTATNIVELIFEPHTIDPSAVPRGCLVWKTDDPALRKQLERTFTVGQPIRRINIDADLRGEIGGEVHLTLTDGTVSTSATWQGPLEPARTRPTTLEEIRQALSRLGNTPFSLGRLTCSFPSDVLLPKSVLNDLRRRAVAELLSVRHSRYRHPLAISNAWEVLRHKDPPASIFSPLTPQITVLVRNFEQLEAVLQWKPAAVYCDFEDPRRYSTAVALARVARIPIGLATLRILKPGEEGFLASVARAQPDIVLIRNLGALEYFRRRRSDIILIGDFSLNVANDLTARWLRSEGLSRLTPSFDLNWEQFTALIQASEASWYEPVVHQHMPMFHNEFCVFAHTLSNGKDWRDCGRPCDRHRLELRDRTGAIFPVLADAGCRNTVFNYVAQSAAEYLGRMLAMGLRSFRIDLLREKAEEVSPLLSGYADVIAGQKDGRSLWRQLRSINQLGVTRGTLHVI